MKPLAASAASSLPKPSMAALSKAAPIPSSPKNPPLLRSAASWASPISFSPPTTAERKTYIVVRNRLIPLPDGLMFMVPTKLMPTAFTRLFSWSTKLRMAREYLFPPEPATQDESVAEMTRRHFGQETVDRLVSPLALRRLRRRRLPTQRARRPAPHGHHGAATPQPLPRHARRAQNSGAAFGNPASPGASRSLFTTLRGGMRQMTDGIAAQLQPGSMHLSSPVHCIARPAHDARRERLHLPQDTGWLIETAFGQERFDGVILALSAWASASLLRPLDAPLAEALAGVPYSSSITVTLGFNRTTSRNLPPGFGFLVPVKEGRSMLACTFVHAKFAGRTPRRQRRPALLPRRLRQRASARRNRRAPHRHCPERAGARFWASAATPNFVRICRSRHAMAQYGVGHLERMQMVRDTVATLPGLALAGNAYQGIGVPDCIRTGQEAAESVLRLLQQEEPAAATA